MKNTQKKITYIIDICKEFGSFSPDDVGADRTRFQNYAECIEYITPHGIVTAVKDETGRTVDGQAFTYPELNGADIEYIFEMAERWNELNSISLDRKFL